MPIKLSLGIALLLAAALAQAQSTASFDAPAAFGARPSATGLSLSPDGQRVAYIAAGSGQSSVLYTMTLEKGARAKAVTRTNGKPDRLGGCWWVANDRLVCQI